MKQEQQLNITMGTDVVLHDRLIFDGETFDPSLSVGIVANLVNSLGKRTPLDVSVADAELIIDIPWVDGRNAGCYGLEVKGTYKLKKWSTFADGIIKYTRATMEGAAEVTVESDYYDVTQVVGYVYSDSPISEVDVTVDDQVGSPYAEVSYEKKKLSIDFHNLRGIVGPEGKQGDSVIVGQGDLPLAHTIGPDNTKAISQYGVTDELTYDVKTFNLSSYTVNNIYINNADPGVWTKGGATANSIFIPVEPGMILRAKAQDGRQFQYAFLTSDSYTQGQTVSTFAGDATARTNIAAGKEAMMVVPYNASYIYVTNILSGSDMLPDYIKVVTTVKDRLTETKATADKLVDDTAELVQFPTTGYPTVGYYINGNTGKWDASPNNNYSFIPVEPNKTYVVTPKSGYQLYFAFLQDTDGIADNASVHYANGYTNRVSINANTTSKVVAPSNAHYFAYFSIVSQANRDPDMFAEQITLKEYVENMPTGFNPSRKIHVRMQRQQINTSTGGYATDDYLTSFSTAKIYKKPVDGVVTFSFPAVASTIGIVGYDKNQAFIERIFVTQVAGVPVVFNVPTAWEYFKFYFYASGTPDIADVTMEGCFPPDCEHFNIAHVTADANGNYFIPITIKVDASQPTNQEDETATVTDTPDIKVGYGLLALPSSYSPDGTPTRLIIFCHGSAVHIGCGAESFPTDSHGKYGVDPTYWLSEGYAVLDIDGMPKGSTSPDYFPEMQHWCVPLAYQFYLAGYEYAIDNYNLCRDGVFLGGRSLGGGMALQIMSYKEIPVKACCPFAPQPPAIFRSFFSRKKSEKEMIADACGIYNPEEVEWPAAEATLDSVMPVIMMDSIRVGESDERYIGNFGRLMQISPSYRLCVNNPSPATLSQTEIQQGNRSKISEVYSPLIIQTPIPTKFFGAYDDTEVNPYWINLWVRMFRNGGCIVEHRMFPTGGHGFDLADENLVQSFVNHKGETLTNVSIAYIEALQFWRRYE